MRDILFNVQMLLEQSGQNRSLENACSTHHKLYHIHYTIQIHKQTNKSHTSHRYDNLGTLLERIYGWVGGFVSTVLFDFLPLCGGLFCNILLVLLMCENV